MLVVKYTTCMLIAEIHFAQISPYCFFLCHLLAHFTWSEQEAFTGTGEGPWSSPSDVLYLSSFDSQS
jgi:hypothetical protein